MKLALFDLDNTLLSGDSDYEWGRFLAARGAIDGADYEAKNLEYYRRYQAGSLDIHEFLAFALAPLAAHPRWQLDAWHREFMRERIEPMIGAAARALVERHRSGGELCALVTATNSFVTAPIARAFGIEHLIATEPETLDGCYTGRVAGTPCFREGKIERVQGWLGGLGHRLEGFDASTFYSDSLNDLPLLERVTHPVAVDPDLRLGAEAARRGWPTISLR